MEKLAFLKSIRFWSMIGSAVIYYLFSKGFIGQEEMVLVETILVGFVSVRSFDRMGESIGNKH